jgi:hypothetical protein
MTKKDIKKEDELRSLFRSLEREVERFSCINHNYFLSYDHSVEDKRIYDLNYLLVACEMLKTCLNNIEKGVQEELKRVIAERDKQNG